MSRAQCGKRAEAGALQWMSNGSAVLAMPALWWTLGTHLFQPTLQTEALLPTNLTSRILRLAPLDHRVVG